MQRLTHYYNGKVAEPRNRSEVQAMTKKLADYEDAEENGTLIRPKGFCCDCRELRLCKNSNVYAECTKVGTIFAPFELDTRTHFCTYFTLAEAALKERESE